MQACGAMSTQLHDCILQASALLQRLEVTAPSLVAQARTAQVRAITNLAQSVPILDAEVMTGLLGLLEAGPWNQAEREAICDVVNFTAPDSAENRKSPKDNRNISFPEFGQRGRKI